MPLFVMFCADMVGNCAARNSVVMVEKREKRIV